MAALCQATGLVLSRKGMGDNFSPLAGTLIRMIAAVVILWVIAIFEKKAKPTIQAAINHRKAFRWVTLGVVFGPVIGIALSLLSVQHAKIGVASTLMALPPVFILPVSYFVYKERLGWQALAGTILSIAGIAVLFLK
jgi:drug/metabolite transporter (DMT)-like permease